MAGLDPSILISSLAAVTAISGAYFTYRASLKSTAIAAEKVDQQAYNQAIVFYQRQLSDAGKQIDRLTNQIDRITSQLDRVSAQLSVEQDVSSILRDQVRDLRAQVDGLNQALLTLKTSIANSNNGAH